MIASLCLRTTLGGEFRQVRKKEVRTTTRALNGKTVQNQDREGRGGWCTNGEG